MPMDLRDPARPREQLPHARRARERAGRTGRRGRPRRPSRPAHRRFEDGADAARPVGEGNDPVPDAAIDRQEDVSGLLPVRPADSLVVREETRALQLRIEVSRSELLPREERLLSGRVHDDAGRGSLRPGPRAAARPTPTARSPSKRTPRRRRLLAHLGARLLRGWRRRRSSKSARLTWYAKGGGRPGPSRRLTGRVTPPVASFQKNAPYFFW